MSEDATELMLGWDHSGGFYDAERGDAFPANKMLGAATLDRLRHGAYRIILEGESYRDPKPTVEGAKNHLVKEAKNTHS